MWITGEGGFVTTAEKKNRYVTSLIKGRLDIASFVISVGKHRSCTLSVLLFPQSHN